MPNMTPVLSMLEKVYLSGMINECVVVIKGGVMACKAMDLTTSVYVEAEAEVSMKDDVMAFGDISLFIKYLKSYPNIDMAMTRVDNRLTIKPKGGATLKYLLADSCMIPTFDEDWGEESRIDGVLQSFTEDSGLVLTTNAVQEFISLMRVFSPKAVQFTVDKKGAVTVTGGNETEHSFSAPLGSSELAECSVMVHSGSLLAVLGLLDYTDNPTIFLGPDSPVVICSPEASWVLMGTSNV